jgi:hypothetical protein
MMSPTLFCCRAGLDVLSSAGLLVEADNPCQYPHGPINETPVDSRQEQGNGVRQAKGERFQGKSSFRTLMP